MRSTKQILQKMNLFYKEVKGKRKGKCMRLQVGNEFQQVKIKDLNNENNVEMFISSVWWGKAFAAEQNIRELKTRIAKLNVQKLKITPTKMIQNSALNMNNMKSEKYGLSPEEIERRSLASEQFKTIFNMHRTKKTKKLHDRLDRYDKKRYAVKRKKLRGNSMIGKKVLVLAERIKMKAVQAIFISSLSRTYLISIKTGNLW